MRKFLNSLTQYYTLDYRSLALTRIFIGLCIVFDILVRFCDLAAHYTDKGIFPRNEWLNNYIFPWSFSFHLANGSSEFIALLFLLHILLAFLLIFGIKTKLVTILLFLFTVSLQNRNWFINNGGDDVLRILLVLAIGLPWGKAMAYDSLRKEHSDAKFSFWMVGLFLQMFYLYFFSYLMKSHPIWRSEYTALYYALGLDIFVTPLGAFVRGFPSLLRFLTIFVIFLEYLGPLLLIFGFLFKKKSPWLKGGLVLLFIGFHLGITLFMNIGVFPFYCIAIWLSFIPKEFYTSKFAFKITNFIQRLIFACERVFLWMKNKIPKKIISETLGGFLVLCILFINLGSLKSIAHKFPFWIQLGRWGHLYQSWNMFSPFPKTDNVWPVVVGEFADGSVIEFITNQNDIYIDSSAEIYQHFKNDHWKKFYLNIVDDEKLAKQLGKYYCQKINLYERTNYRKRLKLVQVKAYSSLNLLNYKKAPVKEKIVTTYYCNKTELTLDKIREYHQVNP